MPISVTIVSILGCGLNYHILILIMNRLVVTVLKLYVSGIMKIFVWKNIFIINLNLAVRITYLLAKSHLK